eukprot:m.95065 g.95065  ORF g.95065 m.95065 type:complete len:403 (-) comp26784_c0_seq1:99-1307(-)
MSRNTAMFATVAFVGLFAIAAASPSGNNCGSDGLCSLNGECSYSVSEHIPFCICDKGWKGIYCGILNLNMTAQVAYGFTPTSKTSSWGGGPPVYDNATKKYHLFVSEIAGHCGMSTWSRMSQSVQAVSDNVEGPYTRVKTIIGTESHNTLYVYSPTDQLHLIYTIFEGISPPSCNPYFQCTDGTTPGGHGLRPPADWANITCKKGGYGIIHYSKSLDGPWTDAGAITVDWGKKKPTWGGTSNPAPIIFPNGTVLLIARGKDATTYPNGTIDRLHNIFLYRADSWNSTYHFVPSDGVEGAINVGGPVPTEDPVLYKGRRGFHILFHSSPDLTHAWSEDGLTWKWSPTIMGPPNHISDGGGDNERPRVVLDANGDVDWVFVGQQLGQQGTVGFDAARTAAFKTI